MTTQSPLQRRIFLAAVALPLLMSGICLGDDPRARRRELLRDASDAGVGLALGRYRRSPPKLLPKREADDRNQLLLPSMQYGLYRYGYGSGYGPGFGFYQGSNLFDWQAPQIRQLGNRWQIEPGFFRGPSSRYDYSTGRWVP